MAKDTSKYPDYVQRMITEGKELRAKTYALNGYLQSTAGQALPAEKRRLMEMQLETMRSYSDVLGRRIHLEEKAL